MLSTELKQITAIEPQAKAGSGRVNVFLDGQFAFSLAQELGARLSPGSSLSEAEVADLRRQDGLHEVYEGALTLLSYRPRSTEELRRRLLRRSFDPSLVDEALKKLQGQQLLDDQQFARFWVENRQSFNPRGGRLLQAELRSKGVDREIIGTVLPGSQEEEQAAYRVAERKARTLKELDWGEFRKRIGESLVRRGFGYDLAATTVRRLWEETHGSAGEHSEDE